MSKIKLVIHIGLPKTGTSFIQSTLLRFKSELSNYGILYPSAGLHGSGHAGFGTGFVERKMKSVLADSNIFNTENDPYRVRDDILYEVACASRKVEKVLLSSESFTLADPVNIKRLHALFAPYFSVNIVVFLRRQDIYAESSRAQAYRVNESGFNPLRLLDEQNRHLNFEEILHNWETVFGQQNIRVIEYPENGSLQPQIYKAFGLPTKLTFGEQNVNVKLGRDLLEFIHFYTRLRYGTEEYFRVLSELELVEAQNPTDGRYTYFYSPEQRQKLVNLCTGMNKKIGTRYGMRLFASLDPNVDTDSWQPYPGLPQEKREKFELVLKKEAPDLLISDAPIDRGYLA